MARYGMTIPFDGVPLAEHRPWYEELVDLGYTDLWSSEASGTDAFTPTGAGGGLDPVDAARHRHRARLHPGAGTHGHERRRHGRDGARAASSSAIGTSSNVIVEAWNDIPFERALPPDPGHGAFPQAGADRGEGRRDLRHVPGAGFRLGRPPAVVPPILVAGLRARDAAPGRPGGRRGHHQLAVGLRCGQGGARGGTPARRSWPGSSCARRRTPRRCSARPASPSPPTSTCRCTPRSTSGWAGDRCSSRCGTPGRRATGRPRWPPSRTRWWTSSSSTAHRRPAGSHIERYIAHGVTTTALAFLPSGTDTRQAIRDLAPARG